MLSPVAVPLLKRKTAIRVKFVAFSPRVAPPVAPKRRYGAPRRRKARSTLGLRLIIPPTLQVVASAGSVLWYCRGCVTQTPARGHSSHQNPLSSVSEERSRGEEARFVFRVPKERTERRFF